MLRFLPHAFFAPLLHTSFASLCFRGPGRTFAALRMTMPCGSNHARSMYARAGPAAWDRVNRMHPLVDPAFVAGRLREPGFVVLDASLPPVGVAQPPDPRSRFLQRHIPGAVFFDIEELSDSRSGLPHTLPQPEEFAREMARLGVGSNMTLAVYEQEGVFSAPRAWWTLRAFGVREVYVLDGGLRAWEAAGLPIESGYGQRPAAYFRAAPDPNAVRTLPQVKASLEAGEQVLDARSAGRFAGTAPEPRPGLRSGHMPGATNLPFTELCVEGRLRSAEELRAIFAAKGVALDRPITTTCGSGVTAAVVALALEIAGARKVSLYDGSWAEYAAEPGAAIAEGS